MSSDARILILETSAPCTHLGRLISSLRIPSTLNLIAKLVRSASIWISLARPLIALSRIRLNSFTMGAIWLFFSRYADDVTSVAERVGMISRLEFLNTSGASPRMASTESSNR